MTDHEEVVRDCEDLSDTALRKKYRTEANSHRAMLWRRKDGATVSPELVPFRDFLRLVGPCPKAGHTLDRLNNDDREYAPGKVAWRSKQDQARNRSNVVFLTDADGTIRSLAEWSDLTGVPRQTMHARRQRGFSDPEVIHGPGSSAGAGKHLSQHFPWPKGAEAQWEQRYRETAKRPTYRYSTSPRRETRAQFMARIAGERYRDLMEVAELTVDPNYEPGPEHDQLFEQIAGWRRVLHRATRLNRRP